MPDFPKLPIINNPPQQQPTRSFPELPILDPDPPRMTLREKYGGLYYLGIGGLIVSVGLVGTFFLGLYQTRNLWAAVYVLNDPQAQQPARLEAAWFVSRSTDSNDRWRMDFALRKDLPALARYIIAEGLTPDSIQADPKGYALSAAKSEGWPDWLRLMIARPMAYAVGQGYRIAWEPLDELRGRSDKALSLWMTYTRAVMGPGDAPSIKRLKDSAAQPGMYQDLAALLVEAYHASGSNRILKLDEATGWLRTNHPPCVEVWEGWEERDGQLNAKSVPKGPSSKVEDPAGSNLENTAKPPR